MPRAVGGGRYRARNGKVYSGRNEAIRAGRMKRKGVRARAATKRRQRRRAGRR